jgi:hypothetical protein
MTEHNPSAALIALHKAQEKAIGIPGLEKSTFTQSGSAITGLTYYDLEIGAKLLYPVPTPLRNIIPRVSGKGGIQANWRAITAINTAGMQAGVSVGNRGGVLSNQVTNYTASYKGIGLESNVDFEAQYAAEGFDDVRALAATTGLQALMLQEEGILLGGNTSVALGQTPTPTLSGSTTGGTLTNQTWSIICVALAFFGVVNGSVAGGIQSSITRTNADGSSDTFGGGASKQSANATVATTGSTGSILGSVAAVSGALGYAWFWGLAGSEVLGAITTINSVSIVAAAAGTQTAASLGTTDQSQNALIFDGLLTQAFKSGSGSYIYTMASGTAGVGTPLTADGAGGVVEIDIVLKYMWDNFRLGPDTMWVNSQEALNISKKILQGSAGAAFKFEFSATRDMIGGGIMVRTYLNRFSMQGGTNIDIKVHPNMPAGTCLFTSRTIPYPMSGVGNVMQVRTRQDYYQIEWPLVSRKYQYGIYADEVLQHYFPASMAVITCVANG